MVHLVMNSKGVYHVDMSPIDNEDAKIRYLMERTHKLQRTEGHEGISPGGLKAKCCFADRTNAVELLLCSPIKLSMLFCSNGISTVILLCERRWLGNNV